MEGAQGWSRIGEQLSDTHITVICAAISLVVFIIDIVGLPLGVATGVAYVPVVLVALWYSKWQYTFVIAAVTSALTALSIPFSEPAATPAMIIANHLLALSAIWLVAIGGSWLILTRQRKEEESLRAALVETEKARAAKLRFMSTASNDIRHHLQTLVLLNATLVRTVEDAKAQNMFAMQGDALGHLSDLMNSLLDITDFETGEVELDIEDVNLGSILQTLDDEFRGSAQAKSLDFEIDPSTEVIRTDRTLLTKALRSLVANAIRYTDEGRVAISCQRENGGLRVTVSDTGIGISEDHLADIFDEFYRVEYNPAARDAGLGLGLTIVDRIARVLGVTLSVDSKPGIGSNFALLLPVNT